MFHEFPENCTIKISNKFIKCREKIPYRNKIINIDEIACNNFENCEKCLGSKETLSFYKCKKGYQLINNKCAIPQCVIGDNEKCLSCNISSGKEKEFSECNEGYYLPVNISDKTKSLKCKIEGCKICQDISGDCIECKNEIKPRNYNPYLYSLPRTECKVFCELGNEEKCLTYNDNIYGSCNKGYNLVNVICKKIDDSFIALYNITSTIKLTRIMCVT